MSGHYKSHLKWPLSQALSVISKGVWLLQVRPETRRHRVSWPCQVQSELARSRVWVARVSPSHYTGRCAVFNSPREKTNSSASTRTADPEPLVRRSLLLVNTRLSERLLLFHPPSGTTHWVRSVYACD